MSKKTLINTTGKRKQATAKATLTDGKGVVRVNGIRVEHASTAMARAKMLEPVTLVGDISKYDIDVTVAGGGQVSQADAVRLAIGRALVELDEKHEKTFLDYDRTLLVADVRFKETSKPNRHGNARAKTQKSYR